MLRSDIVIYRLKIWLSGTRPVVWRRVEVPSHLRLRDLHQVIQTVMGWTDSHLHEFMISGHRYGVADLDSGSPVLGERKVKLEDVVHLERAKFVYEYDFGDRWQHQIRLEKILSPDPDAVYPRCLGGKRACPPEDCGGPSGYTELLTALAEPSHPKHEESREGLGGDLDVEAFDLDRVNEELGATRARAQHADLAWLRP